MLKHAGPEVWYVVPTCRSENIEKIFANVESQSVKGHLLIVENGEAIGTCERTGRLPTICLQSEPNVGSARSAALRYIRSVDPEAFIVWMDDDDTYHHSYTRRVLEHNSRESITMAGGHYANLDGHYFWCSGNVRLEATMSGPQRLFREADGMSTGEGRKMAQNPSKTPLPVCINRSSSGHTWTNSPLKYLTLCQPFKYLGTGVPELSNCDPEGEYLLAHEFVVQFPHVLSIWNEERAEASEAKPDDGHRHAGGSGDSV